MDERHADLKRGVREDVLRGQSSGRFAIEDADQAAQFCTSLPIAMIQFQKKGLAAYAPCLLFGIVLFFHECQQGTGQCFGINTVSGTRITRLSLATNRPRGDAKGQVRKDNQGRRIHNTRWTDTNGTERFGTEIIAERIDFLSRGKRQEELALANPKQPQTVRERPIKALI